MNNGEMKEMFNDLMASLPRDMRLSSRESESLINRFLNDVNAPLQKIMNKMLERASETGNLSTRDRQNFTNELTKLLLPYMQSIADNPKN